MAILSSNLNTPERSLGRKFRDIHWLFIILVSAITGIGVAMLYSAANGNFDPWASKHIIRFGFGVLLLICVALIDLRFWLRWAYAIYFFAMVLLAAVEITGYIGMGAQRWISLGIINVQPSEVMKIGLVLALSRYFHGSGPEDVRRISHLLIPLLMIAMPVLFVLRQPDLGTAIMLMMVSSAIMFLAGVRLWMFAAVGATALAAIPIAWRFLHDYQQLRIITFFNPESDPLGAGYHIIQSKIAFGSGGLFGKGFLLGSQSHLSFLPEKQTDFIFTMLAEEFGMVGGLVLLTLYILVMAYGFAMSLRARNQFGRLLGLGITATFFLYVFINMAMVMGLIPIVGVPLPLISYGGTAMLTVLFSFGLLMSVHVHRDVLIGRRGIDDNW
jgi:rod shape determining protein RodA